jgi:transcriptional regulator
MHPNASFDWTSREEMLEFVSRQSFAHIFAASDQGLFVVHAPVLVTAAGSIQFHVSRRNRMADQIAGRRILISLAGRDAYHSANWYASDNQVPTWHYEAVEIEGDARSLEAEELVEFLDQFSDRFEHEHSPDRPWTRAKMGPGKFEAMTKGIVGFEVIPDEIRGTRKFNQHKTGDDLAAGIDGQLQAGRQDIVAAMRELSEKA